MITSPLLSGIKSLAHGFGTRQEEFPFPVVSVKQVHGTKIFEILGDTAVPSSEPEGYDVILTDRPGVAVAVKTADCLPVLLAEPKSGVIAAVHAGWRGTLQRVSEIAVRRMMDLGCDPQRIVASMGPNIAVCCCEVESDVLGLFQKDFSDWDQFLKRKSETKWLLDVAQCNRLQLLRSGLRPERIDRVDLCTYCREDLFYSYRREGEAAGRMKSFVHIS